VEFKLAASIKVKHAATARKFWALLSPEKPLFPKGRTLLYRGQCSDQWNLTPRVLREPASSAAEEQVRKEWMYLDTFVRHCDSIGLAIPNDSPDFREEFLNRNSLSRLLNHLSEWPPIKMYPLMALAQHYGLPTRLLDWSSRAYVAAYFAISDALVKKDCLHAKQGAVWVLDIEQRTLFRELKVVTVPGSNNANLAAQSGRFTLLTQKGGRAKRFEGEMALDSYFASQALPAPLKKITLPITEAPAARKLCSLYGVTGATLFPDYSGAARATKDELPLGLV